ncbi:CD248 molecule, endosialin a [Colossoma macropomum]|uniref:CD248 molecule, endosialin a n=1 Tax=Colossoma macropomum TaxID=42526 RepID=UPI00186422B9|nr:CD248 molecule, endosialin a [Colossoma macropomum]
MGSPVLSGATLLSVLLYLCSVWTQDLRDRDVLCNENSCLVLYWQRKTFLEAWRSCKFQGGNLVTIKSPEEANTVETLFSKTELREDQRVRVWIGLQRQPRKCSTTRPMRGFSWITGEQDIQYTNWEQEDSPNTCSSPRCVSISYTTAAQERHNNLKWKDGSCSVPLDGYLCRYAFPGMCQVIASEGGGNTLYTTPFQLISAFLTHIPFGSIATVPCDTKGDQTVLCAQREDGTVGWSADPPFCSDVFDPCQESPCEYECVVVMDSYRCACPDGYMLATDEQDCLDVDECLQSPCEQICLNTPGSFECHCHNGYQLNEEGTCEDVDECADFPCEHECENIMGSHICHCRLGFAPLPEDPDHCYDIDECQFEGTCEHMCSNYIGGFECYCKEGYELHPNLYFCTPISEDKQSPTVTASYPWITHLPGPIWETQDPGYHWPQVYKTVTESVDLITESPNVETVPTNLLWLTKALQEEDETTPQTESPPGIITVEVDDLDPKTVSVEAFLPSTTSTPVPEYYEDESSTVSTVLPTTTVPVGTWMWFSSTPKEYKKNESATFEPELLTSTQPLTTTQVTEETTEEVSKSEQTQGSSWLLVGLLVPLCIFFVVMIALGIIYCKRCTAKPQNKNATDCYHWIAGAGEKAAADMSGGGISKV